MGIKKLVKKATKAVKKVAGVALPIAGSILPGPLGDVLGAAGSALLGGKNASKNVDAANQYAQQAQWSPTGIQMPGLGLSFDQNGNPVGSVTDPRNQQLADSMFGLGTGMLGNMIAPGQVGTGNLNQVNMLPMLQQAMAQADQGLNSLPGLGSINPAVSNYQTNGESIISQLGGIAGTLGSINPSMGQFGQAATNALGSLGSFDPNQLAADYANNLRAAARPAEENAANRLAQNLYNTGRLGSTGGAGLMGELGKSLEEADIQRTIAGQQLAGQEQSRLAGMAQGLQGAGLAEQQAGVSNQLGLAGALSGVLGQQAGLSQQQFQNAQGLNTEAFNRAMSLQNQAYTQGMNTTQQRFQNAMNLFGAGNTANQTNLQQGQLNLQAGLGQQGLNMQANQMNLQGGLAALGLGNQFMNQDISNLMSMLQLSNQTSATRSNANLNAYQPAMAAQVARNDTNSSNLQGLLGALGGLFQNQTGATPGINPNASNMFGDNLSNPFLRSQLAGLQLS